MVNGRMSFIFRIAGVIVNDFSIAVVLIKIVPIFLTISKRIYSMNKYDGG
ncbi:MAG: hypothetical protein ACI4FV_02290 [Lachnospiraceae bacterium]